MGLDISIWVEKSEAFFSPDYSDKYSNQHSLSRTFCNFMCRRSLPSEKPELDQIGEITGIDISPLYEMERYGSPEALDFHLQMAESEEEKQSLLLEAEADRQKLRGNIDKVIKVITGLIAKLSVIDNLPAQLDDDGFDSLNYKEYFTDFNSNKGDGYIGNNFGQDLRNFKAFLDYAKGEGIQTVYFLYG